MKTVYRHLKKIFLAIVFWALAFFLPFLIGDIPQIGSMLLPMHIPVMLCGLICGWQYGFVVGLLAPLLRYFVFKMPPMPYAVSMAFELATYGIVIGFLYDHCRRKSIISLYSCLLLTMVAGRGVWGVVQAAMLGIGAEGFTWEMFLSEAFLDAIPGMIIQLALIPAVMLALNRTTISTCQRKSIVWIEEA